MNLLILGIGNILFQDEGIGAHFVHYMDEKYEFLCEDDKSVSIVDGGTLAQRLIPEIVKYDEVVVIDCIDANDSKAGDVYFFDFNNMPNAVNWQGSAHEVEMLQTLNMIKMQRDLPSTMVLGVIPKRVADDTTFDLSEEMIYATATMENQLIRHLKSIGIKVRAKILDLGIAEIAQRSYKREIINGPTL